MQQKPKPISELDDVEPGNIPESVKNSQEPIILRGLVRNWPAVKAGLTSDTEMVDYIKRFYTDKTVVCYIAKPEKRGRFFYTEDCKGLDYESKYVPLPYVLDQLLKSKEETDPNIYYVGSTTVDICLPGFRVENDLALVQNNPLVSIWIGNRSSVPAHFDGPANIACCVAGQRRINLLPIEQVKNLYVGPLDFTPSGQSISMVDFSNPDFEKFPRFREALQAMQVAHLEAGDALYIPPMWWHQIDALNDLNVLVNYWWREVPRYIDPALNALHYAMLCVRDLPPQEKAAWKVLFDHYVFDEQAGKHDHIPEPARGFLSPMTDVAARKLRAWLLNKLNR